MDEQLRDNLTELATRAVGLAKIETRPAARHAGDVVLEIRETRKKMQELRDKTVARIDKELADRLQYLNKMESKLLPKLANWFKGAFKSGKSRDLDGVTLFSRKTPESVKVKDNSKCVEFCKEKGLEVNVTTRETPSKAAIKAYVAATGDTDDSFQVIKSREVFDVKRSKEAKDG